MKGKSGLKWNMSLCLVYVVQETEDLLVFGPWNHNDIRYSFVCIFVFRLWWCVPLLAMIDTFSILLLKWIMIGCGQTCSISRSRHNTKQHYDCLIWHDERVVKCFLVWYETVSQSDQFEYLIAGQIGLVRLSWRIKCIFPPELNHGGLTKNRLITSSFYGQNLRQGQDMNLIKIAYQE